MEKKFRNLVNIIKKLRAPDGCPWDREQNLYSLKDYVIEEVFEFIDALDRKDINNIKEELGDILLHVLFHSIIAEEEGLFTLNEVIDTISEKLIRRHPHVFGDIKVKSTDEVLINWEKIKAEEKKKGKRSILDDIPAKMPSIQRSYKLQERAKKVGFDWQSSDECMMKVHEEFNELQDAIKTGNLNDIEHEFGDLLFALINLSRFLNVNADEALRKANNRFVDRFKHIENRLAEKGLSPEDATLDELEQLWKEAKKVK
ncbi:nucleoside triphosphate pyrophosphohydrolase [Deferribacter autotrophicus]|uniref:Nucleoside triphosphate pyrophosphohydrolase n=1 Tax=Deferribacter autotrophicus TaxID=500465 RepID=A0A5A8F4H6_9BACT|nr:nucleoside triphosphate pyrophosphohydrolase [Deferribacter autotrophicus]KAA0258491.1 nucleoside triphosphate pyrophosphohydrolase [Deferribacter autotrophicus]